MSRIEGLREWAEASEFDGLVHLELGDERGEEHEYSLTMTAKAARALASQLTAAADEAVPLPPTPAVTAPACGGCEFCEGEDATSEYVLVTLLTEPDKPEPGKAN